MIFKDLPAGKSVQGRAINAFANSTAKGDFIYLIAGTHGDEIEGIFVLQKLYQWIKTEAKIDLPMVVLPVLNPDGEHLKTRTNANGVDLNRNLGSKNWSPNIREAKYHPGPSPFSEPENLFLRQLFESFRPKLIFSFHSWVPMLNYNGDCQKIAQFLNHYNNYPICEEIEGHPTPGSLGEYAQEAHQCPVLTFECPRIAEEDITLSGIWQKNREGLCALFDEKGPLLKND